MPYERDPYQNALIKNRPRNALRPVTVANGLQGMPNALIPRPKWYSPERQPGSVEPGIYAEPTAKQKKRELLPKWYTRERGEEGIYAEPPLDLAEMIEDAGLPGIGMVKAYHGGGVFKKFSDKFMKTGTGGHVFGWGHYVSEEKGVAKHYEGLYKAEHPQQLYIDGKNPTIHDRRSQTAINNIREVVQRIGDKKHLIEHQLETGIRNISTRNMTPSIMANASSDYKKVMNENVQGLKDALKIVKGSKKFEIKGADAAHYKVKLFKGKDPSEYTFLDWDKPVPINVAEKLITLAKKTDKFPASVIQELEDVKRFSKSLGKPDGGTFYEYLAENMNPRIARNLGIRKLDDKRPFDRKEAASKFLERAGISGIRYPVGSLSGIKPATVKVLVDGKKISKVTEVSEAKGNIILQDALIAAQEGDIRNIDEAIKIANNKYNQYTDPDTMLVFDFSESEVKKLMEEAVYFLKSGRIEIKAAPVKKNYVIFNPKNIQIDEGPGFRRVMEGEKPVKAKSSGTWTPPEHPKFTQPAKGAKPVKVEPWQMTRAEFLKPVRAAAYKDTKTGNIIEGDTADLHFDITKKEGISYKDLGKRYIAGFVDHKGVFLTRKQARNLIGRADRKTQLEVHKEYVQEAIVGGKPVPDRVLRNYPDLKTPESH